MNWSTLLPGKEKSRLSTVRAMDCSLTTSMDCPMCTVDGMLPRVPRTNSATSCTVNICSSSSKMAGNEFKSAAWGGIEEELLARAERYIYRGGAEEGVSQRQVKKRGTRLHGFEWLECSKMSTGEQCWATRIHTGLLQKITATKYPQNDTSSGKCTGAAMMFLNGAASLKTAGVRRSTESTENKHKTESERIRQKGRQITLKTKS